ncbi:MAG TPA: sugar ABC transporter permease [Candidatus Onthovivens sp.]|nr:sugar ABC transporter permease [Candidatus Onthovivens sp.]
MSKNEKTINKEVLIEEFEDKSLGLVKEGFNEKENVYVHITSRKKSSSKYVSGGVLDNEQANNWKAWLYLAPVLILMAIFLVYPLINTIAISFMSNYNYVKGTFDGFTLDNFGAILGLSTINGVTETRILDYALPNTFFMLITVPISIAIALLISVLLNSLKWLQKVFQIVFFLPYVTNAIAIGMVFSVIFDKQGVINDIFNLTDFAWIYGADRWVAMIPLCLYIVWSALPFKILILLSGLQGVDKQYYQAAKIDATPKWKVLMKITVPALSPQILYLMVTSFIGAFKEYSSIVAMFNGPGTTNGSYNMYTIVYYIYDNLNSNTSLAAAAAVLLFAIILVFTFLQLYLSKKKVHY